MNGSPLLRVDALTIDTRQAGLMDLSVPLFDGVNVASRVPIEKIREGVAYPSRPSCAWRCGRQGQIKHRGLSGRYTLTNVHLSKRHKRPNA
ncbi:MAG: hypothetical protein P8179_16545 [Candidatus Thiodiazotropha sp.]